MNTNFPSLPAFRPTGVKFGENKNRDTQPLNLPDSPAQSDMFVPAPGLNGVTFEPDASLTAAAPVLSQDAVNEAVSKAAGKFTSRVMGAMTDKATTENTVFMPSNTFLLASALRMGAPAAADKTGETKRQLDNTLFLPGEATQGQLSVALGSLRQELADLEKTGITFKTGYGAWTLSNAVTLNPDFVARMKEQGADVSQFSAGDASPINNWVKKMTQYDTADGPKSGVEKILEDKDLTGNARMVLGAASFFKAPLRYKFKYVNSPSVFNGVNGQQNVQMMKVRQSFNHISTKELHKAMTNPAAMVSPEVLAFSRAPRFEAFTLPYGDKGNNNLSVTVLVPDEDSNLKDVYQWASGFNGQTGESRLQETLAFLNNGRHETKLDLTMPKFKTDTEVDTKEVLQRLGLNSPFDESANFTGIATAPSDLYVAKMKQMAFVDFDKDGTVGGAADVAQLNTRSARIEPDEYKHITVDRPFMYVIHDSKRPLMVGTVNNA